jgi:hypothetical protein
MFDILFSLKNMRNSERFFEKKKGRKEKFKYCSDGNVLEVNESYQK